MAGCETSAGGTCAGDVRYPSAKSSWIMQVASTPLLFTAVGLLIVTLPLLLTSPMWGSTGHGRVMADRSLNIHRHIQLWLHVGLPG